MQGPGLLVTSLRRNTRACPKSLTLTPRPRRDYTTALARGQHRALVAELVDAQVSGTCDRKVVEVRVFSRAPANG